MRAHTEYVLRWSRLPVLSRAGRRPLASGSLLPPLSPPPLTHVSTLASHSPLLLVVVDGRYLSPVR